MYDDDEYYDGGKKKTKKKECFSGLFLLRLVPRGDDDGRSANNDESELTQIAGKIYAQSVRNRARGECYSRRRERRPD